MNPTHEAETSHAVPPSPPPKRSVSLIKLIAGAVLVVVVLTAGVLLANPIRRAVTAVLPGGHTHASEASATQWTCGMHPWVILPTPEGGCPICGMDLVPLDPGDFTGELAIDPTVVQNIGVRYATVTTGPLRHEIRTVGSVVVDETAIYDVNTRFSGWIEELEVDQTGQAVEAGEVLFHVYSPQLFSAAEEYRLANAAASNQPTDVQQRLADAARQRLELFGLDEQEIARLSDEAGGTVALRSPVDGVVLEKSATQGMRLEPGMRMYRIADLSQIWIEAAVYEDQLPYVAEGQSATVSFPYLPGRTFESRVAFVSPTLDPQTRQAQVRLELDNEQDLLKPGMFASVVIESVVNEEATLMPREAALDTGRQTIAMVAVVDGRFEQRELTLGTEAAGGMVQVLEGLIPGERVVTSGQFLLDSEARVREGLAKMLGADTVQAEVQTEAPATRPMDEAEAVALNALLRAYLDAGDQLADDRITAAAATNLAEAAEAYAAEHNAAESIAKSARAFAEAADELDAARRHFAALSQPLIEQIRQTGVPADIAADHIVAFRCPMYPSGESSWWLQREMEPRNPYYGSAMLRCFDQREHLPTTSDREE